MQREIKFRAWDKKLKQWCRLHFNGPQPVWVIGGEPDWGDVSELMQFTGLKDKNGKEIYEGDIVRTRSTSSRNTQIIWPIGWDPNDGCWCFVYDTGEPAKNFARSERKQMEIIGNIYENPELLKI